jgi:hypothetical protein
MGAWFTYNFIFIAVSIIHEFSFISDSSAVLPASVYPEKPDVLLAYFTVVNKLLCIQNRTQYIPFEISMLLGIKSDIMDRGCPVRLLR